MRMDWTDLRVMLHVYEAGSMTAAAARCHLTLAAVSARVRGLESSLGVTLLQRRARGVTPTPAGALVVRHARAVFAQVQQLEVELLHARADAAPACLLLANSAALARPLDGVLADTAAGGTPLRVRESASEATVQALRSGAADVGIISDAVDTRGLQCRALGPDPLVVVTAPGHPLAGAASVHFTQTLSHPWVAWGEHGALATHLQLRAAALGLPLRAVVHHPAIATVLRLVARGVGITVLPRALVQADAAVGVVACVPLAEHWAARRLLACHAADGDGARGRLVQALQRGWPAP